MKAVSLNQCVRVLRTFAVLIAAVTGGSIGPAYGGECPLVETFDGPPLNPGWAIVGDPEDVMLTTERAYEGRGSLKLTVPGDGPHELEAIHGSTFPIVYAWYYEYALLSVWLYDGEHIGAGNRAGFYVRGRGTDEYVGLVSSPDWTNYRIDTPAGELDTGYARSEGWHRLGIAATPAGVRAWIGGDGAATWVPYDGPSMILKEASLRFTGPSRGVAYFDEYTLFRVDAAEPSTAALLLLAGFGAIALGIRRRTRRNRAIRS